MAVGRIETFTLAFVPGPIVGYISYNLPRKHLAIETVYNNPGLCGSSSRIQLESPITL